MEITRTSRSTSPSTSPSPLRQSPQQTPKSNRDTLERTPKSNGSNSSQILGAERLSSVGSGRLTWGVRVEDDVTSPLEGTTPASRQRRLSNVSVWSNASSVATIATQDLKRTPGAKAALAYNAKQTFQDITTAFQNLQLCLRQRDAIQKEHLAKIELYKRNIHMTQELFTREATTFAAKSGMDLGDITDQSEISIVEMVREFKEQKQAELFNLRLEFKEREAKLKEAQQTSLDDQSQVIVDLKNQHKKDKRKLRDLHKERLEADAAVKSLTAQLRELDGATKAFSNLSTSDLQAVQNDVVAATQEVNDAITRTKPNELDFTLEGAGGDVEEVQSVQEVRPEDLDTTINQLNEDIKAYYDSNGYSGTLPILSKKDPLISFMNDILPELDELTVSFLESNEVTGTLALTDDIEYEENGEEVSLADKTEINTLENLNKVIKYLLKETTIKLKGISAEKYVAGSK